MEAYKFLKQVKGLPQCPQGSGRAVNERVRQGISAHALVGKRAFPGLKGALTSHA